jgi:hypothetical protein
LDLVLLRVVVVVDMVGFLVDEEVDDGTGTELDINDLVEVEEIEVD